MSEDNTKISHRNSNSVTLVDNGPELKGFISWLHSLGRSDVYATLQEWNGKKLYGPCRRQLTDAVVDRHLFGAQPIGMYIMNGDTTKVAAIDLDDHQGTLSWEQMASVAHSIGATLADYGMQHICFRSGGGRGIHIFILFKRPQSARAVRHFLETALEVAGLSVGNLGVSAAEAEIFPKQDMVEPGMLGSLIAMPLARQSTPLDAQFNPVPVDTFVVPAFDQLLNDDLPEQASQISTAPSRGKQADLLPGDEDEVANALKHVEARDYHIWVVVGLILKGTLGENGFKPWLDWSRTAPDKFKGDEDCRKKWRSFKPRNRVGVGTLYYLAQQRGWNGPSDPQIRRMNERFGILTHRNKTLVIVKEVDGSPPPQLTMLAKDVFIDRLKPETETVTDTAGAILKRPLAPYWLSHRKAVHYYGVEFDPSKPPGHNGRIWNIWQGFALVPAPGSWDKLQDHIYKNICRSDEQKYLWLLNWMALGVQCPAEPIGTAPVLKGLPGTGKGYVANAYGKVWGSHYTTITNPAHVSGRFNAHLIGKRFVFIDEGTFGGSRKDAGTLKTRITEKSIILEQKGVDPIEMRNSMIFMIASNEDSIVPADLSDRRWMLFDVGDEHREDHKYFAEIAQQMENGGYEAMLYDLLRRDWRNGPDPRRIIRTPELFEQIIRAQPVTIRFLHQLLDDGRLPQNDIAGPCSTTTRALLEELQATHSEVRYVSLISLGRFLRSVIPGITDRLNGSFRDGRDGTIRATQLNFPRLAECRQCFERHVGAPVPWSNDLLDWRSDHEDDPF